MRFALFLFSITFSLVIFLIGLGSGALNAPRPATPGDVLALAAEYCPPTATGSDAWNCMTQAEMAIAAGKRPVSAQ